MSKEPTDVMIGAYLTLDPAKTDYEAVTHAGVKLGEQVPNAMNSLIVISTNGGSTDPSTTPPTPPPLLCSRSGPAWTRRRWPRARLLA